MPVVDGYTLPSNGGALLSSGDVPFHGDPRALGVDVVSSLEFENRSLVEPTQGGGSFEEEEANACNYSDLA